MRNKHLLAVEKEKIAILTAQGMTPNRIGGIIGRDPKTVISALAKPDVAGKVEEVKTVLAEEYENLARRMINSITDEDICKINAYQRTLAGAVATDKMRLLRDQSTDNVSIMTKLVYSSPDLPDD